MNPTIVCLTREHAGAAARLVRDRLEALRRDVPRLPERCLSVDRWAEPIARLADRGHGVAALENDRLVGLVGAFPITYGRRPSMLSPEWGHGVAPNLPPSSARRVYEALYAEAAREWTLAGAETHILALLAHDAPAAETFSWFGFGGVVCDAVRSLDAVPRDAGRVDVRRATPSDAALVCELDLQLHRTLESPPTLLAVDDDEDEEYWAERLADPARAIWLTGSASTPLGYLIQGPASGDACDLIKDLGTSSITGAYVDPSARGAGLATALLSRAVEWAREQGYSRIAVDFETANTAGSRFWLSHFQPVVVSWARTIRARGAT